MDGDQEHQQQGPEYASAADLAALHASLGDLESQVTALRSRQDDAEKGVLAAEKQSADTAADFSAARSDLVRLSASVDALAVQLHDPAAPPVEYEDRFAELERTVSACLRVMRKAFPQEV